MSTWLAGVSAAIESSGYSLPSGNRDLPGRARLVEIHPLLDVGNELAASYSEEQGHGYSVVLSTVTPREAQNPYQEASYLSTLEFKWYDACGRETPAGEAEARKNIIAAAKALDNALRSLSRDGPRALVHCAYGQNRSNAVCVAYAILYCGWTPTAAIQYARKACLRDRRYFQQKPLHNQVFNRILKSFKPTFDGTGAQNYQPTGLTVWLGIHSASSLLSSTLSASSDDDNAAAAPAPPPPLKQDEKDQESTSVIKPKVYESPDQDYRILTTSSE